MTEAANGFTLVRTFDATPEELWQAWTDPDSAAQWWHPGGMSTPRQSVEIDARVGGRYTYAMVDDATGDKVVTVGVYREVVPFERLVFTWSQPGADADHASVVTVTLEPAGERTRMTFDLRRHDQALGDEGDRDGWTDALDVLEEYLARSRVGG